MWSAPLLYLAKAHAVLLLFAAAYFGLLRPLTFFALNRAYLVLALLFAAVYPALPVPALWPAAAPAPAVAWVLAGLPAGGAPAAALPAPGPDWPALLLAGYAAGAALLLGRLLVQLLSLARLRRTTRAAVGPGGVAYRALGAPGGPFSFGRTIYLDPAQHPAPAELAAVLAHEQAHVRQAHTLDVLLAHVATAVFWANPAAWLLRRALLDNLEYLADAATLRTGLDRRAYQYSLLRLGPLTSSPALVSPFSLSTLKNRILMMNQPVSNRLQLLRYALAGPLVVAAALAYSAAHAQPAPAATPADESFAITNKAGHTVMKLAGPAAYYVDGQTKSYADLAQVNPAAVASVRTVPAAQARPLLDTGQAAYVITTEAKKAEPAVVAFNEKVRRVAPDRIGINGQGEATLTRDGAPSASPGAAAEERPAAGKKIVYYVDGKLVGTTLGSDVNPRDIARIDVLKGEQARELLGDASGVDGVAIVTTKAGEHLPEVVEFNEKFRRIEPLKGMVQTAPARAAAPVDSTEKAVSPMYLGSAGLAYITKNHPDARLVGVDQIRPASGGAPRYRATIVIGRRPGYITFGERGEFISESYNK